MPPCLAIVRYYEWLQRQLEDYHHLKILVLIDVPPDLQFGEQSKGLVFEPLIHQFFDIPLFGKGLNRTGDHNWALIRKPLNFGFSQFNSRPRGSFIFGSPTFSIGNRSQYMWLCDFRSWATDHIPATSICTNKLPSASSMTSVG